MQHFDIVKDFKFEKPGTYCIRVKGHLKQGSSDFLGGMSITTSKEEGQTPVTTLIGRLKDQAELMGVLNSLYEFHMPLLSVEMLSIQ